MDGTMSYMFHTAAGAAMPTSKSPANLKEPRTERMELRVQPSAKRIIQRAMAVSGRSAADLAYEAARRVRDAHERIGLTGRDRAALPDRVLTPPAPNTRTAGAFKRPRAMTSEQIESSAGREGV